MTPILTIENLRVEIPVKAGLLKAVRGVDLAIDPGETHGLVGESGSGKSLTALAVMGLLPRKARRSAKTLRFADIDLMALPGREMEDIRGDRPRCAFAHAACAQPAPQQVPREGRTYRCHLASGQMAEAEAPA
jgi:peptide/nickel transport system ATP-binding protein